jgi:hypothetical protein
MTNQKLPPVFHDDKGKTARISSLNVLYFSNFCLISGIIEFCFSVTREK